MTIHPKQKLTVYTGRSKKFKLDSNLKNSQAGPKKANKGLKGGQIKKKIKIIVPNKVFRLIPSSKILCAVEFH